MEASGTKEWIFSIRGVKYFRSNSASKMALEATSMLDKFRNMPISLSAGSRRLIKSSGCVKGKQRYAFTSRKQTSSFISHRGRAF